jgi:hypothetical protein
LPPSNVDSVPIDPDSKDTKDEDKKEDEEENSEEGTEDEGLGETPREYITR